jgi:hypothetical protein
MNYLVLPPFSFSFYWICCVGLLSTYGIDVWNMQLLLASLLVSILNIIVCYRCWMFSTKNNTFAITFSSITSLIICISSTVANCSFSSVFTLDDKVFKDVYLSSSICYCVMCLTNIVYETKLRRQIVHSSYSIRI